MIKIKKEIFFSAPAVLVLYILASALVIMGFRFIFPGEAAPLACFASSWRLIRGLVDFLELFPAVALSALVIPFGLVPRPEETASSFSPQFFRSFKTPIAAAIAAAMLNGLLASLVFPLALDYEANLRSRGRLYRFAEETAREHAGNNEWNRALHFIGICESIWPGGDDISGLKIEAEIHTQENRLTPEYPPDIGTDEEPALSALKPVNATEALVLAETALAEERYFDAHWLATLGGRLAGNSGAEAAAALRLAGRAWNGANSMAPNAGETEAYRIYRLKRDGHEALLGEEWIRAYFIFRELSELRPEDPDAAKYLALSEDGLARAAFFIDEMETTPGTILAGALFSLPHGPGRLVIRISSLSTFPDFAYGAGVEALAFDNDGRPLWSVDAPYAKILPLALDSVSAVTILLRALDRSDGSKQWFPAVRGFGQAAPNNPELVLSVSWDNFLLLADARRGLPGFSPAELKRAAGALGSFGHQPEVFEAELLRRFAEPFLFFPLCVAALVIGWRYRARARPRYTGFPMLAVLPLVFNGVIQFCGSWGNKLGIWAVISLGFTTASVLFGTGILALLIFLLIVLAAQRG